MPVSLLEDFLGAFHRRMLERMRTADQDPSFFARNDTRKSIDSVEDEGSVDDSPRRFRKFKANPSFQVGMGMQRAHARDRQGRWSQLSEGPEKECTGGDDAADGDPTAYTPRERNLKSVRGPLGDQNVNSRDSQAQSRCKGHTSKRSGDRVSCTPSESEDRATTFIRDPFSLDQRKRLTTDAARYKCWASSSSIVHDARQDTKYEAPLRVLHLRHMQTVA